MRGTQKSERRVYRLPPCPAYDVEGMEGWLSEMAQNGLFLAKDGFFAGVASFERGEPRPAKYRLEAAKKSTGMWAENNGDPDPEEIELGEKYAWSYIAKRGDFYIYRSLDPGTRELNTDPEVQALALNAVKKRRFSSLLSTLIWIVLYGILYLHSPLLTVISVHTWFFLLTAVLVLWVIADSVTAFVHLGRLQKKLRGGLSLDTNRNWKKRALRYHGKNLLQIALAIVLIVFSFHTWSISVLDEDKMPLEAYSGKLPFATMQELSGKESEDYQVTMPGIRFNSVREWSDWLAPRCIAFREHARITLSDGHVLDGGLYVDYFQAADPTVARMLAEEFLRADQSKKNFQLMEAPVLSMDFTAAYYDEVHFPTVILQKGAVVARIRFYQTSENDTLSLGEWASLMAESIFEP